MRIVNYIFYGSLIAFTTLALGFFVLVKLQIAPNPFPPNVSEYVPKAFIVESGSMEPAVKVGSLVFTLKSGTYFPGEIITFKAPNNPKLVTTHRIQFKNFDDGVNKPPVYLTGGDANDNIDQGSVADSQIVGKVFLTVPYAGYVASFAKDPKGFILLVIVPATIIIYEELKFLRKEFGKAFTRLLSKVKKKKIRVSINFLPAKEDKPLPRAAIIIPVIGALIAMVSFSIAYFSDIEKSVNNILGAARNFSEQGVSPQGASQEIKTETLIEIPTPTLTTTPVETPTPTPEETRTDTGSEDQTNPVP